MPNSPLKKILVVDDEEEILTHLSNILKRANYEVISTTKGKQAIGLAQNLKPDLMILDVVIPDMLGGEIARILSESPSTHNIPIIFISGLNTQEDVEIIRKKTGNYHILAKPITAEEILETVSKVLDSG